MTSVGFSVAMATYNGERFLQEQLVSLASQDLLPQELVVMDDRSEDHTLAILEEFASSAPFPVRISQNELNEGHGDTFLKAASRCSGTFVAFCDQDDVWLRHKLSRCAEVLARDSRIDLLSHSAQQVDAELNRLPHRMPDHRSYSVRGPLRNPPLSVLPGFTCCVRKSILENLPSANRPVSVHFPEDLQSHDRFIYHVANTYGYIARIPDSLALYRRHDGAITGSKESGIYFRDLRTRFRHFLYSQRAGFLVMKEQAKQHKDYYSELLEEMDSEAFGSEFLGRTREAKKYYERMESSYEIRSKIYAHDSKIYSRIILLLRGVLQGSYCSWGRGRGLGGRALLKDTVYSVLAWK